MLILQHFLLFYFACVFCFFTCVFFKLLFILVYSPFLEVKTSSFSWKSFSLIGSFSYYSKPPSLRWRWLIFWHSSYRHSSYTFRPWCWNNNELRNIKLFSIKISEKSCLNNYYHRIFENLIIFLYRNFNYIAWQQYW